MRAFLTAVAMVLVVAVVAAFSSQFKAQSSKDLFQAHDNVRL